MLHAGYAYKKRIWSIAFYLGRDPTQRRFFLSGAIPEA
jgi:hypothetical protein